MNDIRLMIGCYASKVIHTEAKNYILAAKWFAPHSIDMSAPEKTIELYEHCIGFMVAAAICTPEEELVEEILGIVNAIIKKCHAVKELSCH